MGKLLQFKINTKDTHISKPKRSQIDDEDFKARMARIKKSLSTINKLMTEIKTMRASDGDE